jgi:lipid-A-disaccharide synthase
VPVTYVGHPLAEVIPLQPDTAGARQRLGLTGPAGWWPSCRAAA